MREKFNLFNVNLRIDVCFNNLDKKKYEDILEFEL